MKRQVGDEWDAPNGYRYVQHSTGRKLKHHVVYFEKTGHWPDSAIETCRFRDGNIHNFNPSNIYILTREGKNASNSGLNKRLTTIEDRMLSYVEDHHDPKEAIQHLQDAVNQLKEIV